MPSFDIVSRIDLAEVDNAVAGMIREIATRFDFKGSKCTIERQEGNADRGRRRRAEAEADARAVEGSPNAAQGRSGGAGVQAAGEGSGNTLKQTIVLRQGVDANLAKQLIREIKDSKLKVQVSIQGDELRVTGKKRDDLQAAISVARGLKIEQPLQYLNFRD